MNHPVLLVVELEALSRLRDRWLGRLLSASAIAQAIAGAGVRFGLPRGQGR